MHKVNKTYVIAKIEIRCRDNSKIESSLNSQGEGNLQTLFPFSPTPPLHFSARNTM